MLYLSWLCVFYWILAKHLFYVKQDLAERRMSKNKFLYFHLPEKA